MKKLFVFCALIGLLWALPASAQEDQCFNKGGQWDAEAQTCHLMAGVEINIHYPLELTGNSFVEETIDTFVQQQREGFLTMFHDSGFYPGPGTMWSLWIDYEIFQHSETVMSVKFTIADYTGGAHPNSYFQTYTFDLANEQVIDFEDLFVEGTTPLATIVPIVRQSLTESLGEMADPIMLEPGTSEDPINYQQFVLTENSLIILFPPYQVAAYAAGPQMVEIPLSELSAILVPEFQQ